MTLPELLAKLTNPIRSDVILVAMYHLAHYKAHVVVTSEDVREALRGARVPKANDMNITDCLSKAGGMVDSPGMLEGKRTWRLTEAGTSHVLSLLVAEVIRPRDAFTPSPLPEWCKPVLEKFPQIELEVRKLWDFFKRRTMPTRQLNDVEAKAIQDLFNNNWIKLIHLDERTINEAVTIARKYGLKPMDAIHAASAFLKRPPIDEFHYFDKDYTKVSGILKLATPSRISSQEEFREFVRPITERH